MSTNKSTCHISQPEINSRVNHFKQQTLMAKDIPPNMMKQKPQIRELPM